MASYTIDYSVFDHNPALKRHEALKGVEDYLGRKRMNEIAKKIITDPTGAPSRSDFIVSLAMFVGISGFAAEAWADSLGLVDPKTKQESLTDAMAEYYIMVELAIELDSHAENDERIDPKTINKGTVLAWLETEDDILSVVAMRVREAVESYRKAKVASNQGDSTS